jgi:SAM-dependent methyltransferase
MSDNGTVLFVSHPKAQCGVHQFGLAVSGALGGSRKYDFRYVECGDAGAYQAAMAQHAPAAVIYNYYPSTLPWLKRAVVETHPVPHIGIMHEVTQAKANAADRRLFDFHIGPDPTLLLSNPTVFKTGRLVPRYDKRQPMPEIPTIGSFGFGTAGKGFERLISQVQQEFDRAVIRLNIPFASFGDASGDKARAIAAKCRSLITKPGIQLDLRHEFMTVDQLLDFLAQNSLNAFFYEYQNGRGISSVVDHALAVKRPLAITRSSMFRHVHGARPPITIEDARLVDILQRGFTPLARYAQEWTEENLRWDYERIVDSVLRQSKATTASSTSAGAPATSGLQLLGEVTQKLVQTAAPLLRQVEQRLLESPYGERIGKAIESQPLLRAGLKALREQMGGARPTAAGSASADWIPQTSEGSTNGAGAPVAPYVPVAIIQGLNRILDRSAFATYQPAIDYLFRHMPEIMARKIAAANIQQAFVLDTVLRLLPQAPAASGRPSLLCVGSYQDTAAGAIALGGLPVEEVDPVINYDLSTFLTKPSTRPGSYDVVFSTSVIEHIVDDEEFIKQFELLLAPGGFGVLTCDFNDQYRPGDRLPIEDRRFYTQRDLRERLLPLIPGCELVDQPNWDCPQPDFEYSGCRYAFASLVFQKLK